MPDDPHQSPLYVGINIASGTAYIGAVRCPDEVLDADQADRVIPSEELDYPASLEDFRRRVAQELRRLQPAAVGLARTRMFKNWTMASATARFGYEAAAMLAAVGEGIPCELVRQEDAARSVEVPIKEASDFLPEALGIEKTPYWKERSIAFMIARHLAAGGC